MNYVTQLVTAHMLVIITLGATFVKQIFNKFYSVFAFFFVYC